MKGRIFIVGALSLSLQAIAQPPLALLHVDLSAPRSSFVEVVESTISFDLQAGLILVEAGLDGEKGLYVIDTGAPGLILNQKPERNENLNGRGITGAMEVEEIRVE